MLQWLGLLLCAGAVNPARLYKATSLVVNAVDGQSCIDDVMAIGAREPNGDDYPFIVNCGIGGGGSTVELCLSGHTRLLQDGNMTILAKDLNEGDLLVSVSDPYKASQVSSLQPIEYFLHRTKSADKHTWVRVTASPYSSLILSPTHLVFTKANTMIVNALPASELIPDFHQVFHVPSNTWVNVTSVTSEQTVDTLVVPMTHSGTLVAEGLLVSSFSAPTPASLAPFIDRSTDLHSLFLPYARTLLNVKQIPKLGPILTKLAEFHNFQSRKIWSYILKHTPPSDIWPFLQQLRIDPLTHTDREPIAEMLRSIWHQSLWFTNRFLMGMERLGRNIESAKLEVEASLKIYKEILLKGVVTGWNSPTLKNLQ